MRNVAIGRSAWMDASQLQGVSLIKNLHCERAECQSKEMMGPINRSWLQMGIQ